MVLQKTEGEGFLGVDEVCFGRLFLVLFDCFWGFFVCLLWGFHFFFWLGFFCFVWVFGYFLVVMVIVVFGLGWISGGDGGVLCFFKRKDFY